MASTTEEAEDFMEGPLIIWLKSCLEDPDIVIDYNDLVDGVLLYQVLLQIDPEPAFSGVSPSQGNSQIRVRNLEIVLKNLRNLYQEEFNQLVIMVPNVVRLGTECNSPEAKNDLNLLLLLLLACAVQCPNKEIFIDRIKQLPLDVQHSIVDHIKQFTDTPLMVLGVEQESSVSSDILLNHVRHLVKERDEFLASWANAALGDASNTGGNKPVRAVANNGSSESHHLAVELADWKSKHRKQRQELDEKTEALNECKDELEVQKSVVARLRQEMSDIVQDARSAKVYRDELDIMRERAERAEKLEAELERFKTKLRDVDFFKTRVEELRDDNRVLMDTREMLEGQLERARKRGDRVMVLEEEILRLKQQNNELSLEKDAKDRKLDELYSELAELKMVARSVPSNDLDLQELSVPSDSSDNSLSSQLSNNATARALRLELENHRLRSAIENLKESALVESNAKLLAAEHENKRMSINMEQLEEQCKRLTAENKEMESLVKDALQESKKLQESREALRGSLDLKQAELQASREELEVAKQQLEETNEEFMKLLPRLKELEDESGSMGNWQQRAAIVPQLEEQLNDVKTKLEISETQTAALHKEISRLKEAIEDGHIKTDDLTSKAKTALKEKEQLVEELQTLKNVANRLHEVELERDELISKTRIADQTLQTLQTELVQQKVDSQNLKSSLSRLGLSSELLLDPNVTLGDLLRLPGLKEQLPAELREECQNCLELAALREEIARQQVLVSTLQSQINSLNSQHTAVQLANTQLAAEKEQLEEERKAERTAHEQLLLDQTSLQRLHEQLTSEHDTVVKKQETLRQQIRTQQREIQTLREAAGRQEAAQDRARAEREQLEEKTMSLKNLRDEHSKLKTDFRELFSSTIRLKEDYKRMQEEYKSVRVENSELQMVHMVIAKLKEEIMALSDSERHLQLQNSKLTQANAILEEDRRSVMDHASILLAQYQELFTHSLEDNQHYHAEEKQFADRLNELRRQKEKLEEKIMDQYKRLDSTTSKKKGFGASLVRKVRKAGSELMNRSRRSLHEDSRASVNIQGSESGENESDASFEDARHEDETSELPRVLKEQGAGTRQTVYEAEQVGGGRSSSGSLLVRNRLNTTTIVTERAPPSPSLSLRSQNTEEARRKTRKDDIYFDYGCV